MWIKNRKKCESRIEKMWIKNKKKRIKDRWSWSIFLVDILHIFFSRCVYEKTEVREVLTSTDINQKILIDENNNM